MANSGFDELGKKIFGVWRGLGRSQQAGIAVIGLVAVGAMVALISWAGKPEYGTVYNNLSQQDAGAMVAKLKELKTPYQLGNGGTSILVPSNLVYDTRLQLASAGLVHDGGVGFELFNQSNFGMTDFAEKVNYQRALEGELSRTINHLAPVEQSRVHLVIPQPTLYTDDQKDTTASVVLALKPGQRLKDAQVQGIAQLISGAVEGLKIENVTIVDSNGNVLSSFLGNSKDPFKSSSSQLDSQRAFEADLEQRIQGMLDKVLGYGKATVRAQALFDWDQVESNSEIYSPSDRQPQVLSLHQTTEQSGGADQVVGGVPGTKSNLPGSTGVISGTVTQGSYAKTDTTTNYELSKTVEKVSKGAATLKKLSVAVVLDGSSQIADGQLAELNKLVGAAAGIDPARGDVLQISSLPFNKEVPAGDLASMQESQRWQQYTEIGKVAAMAIGPVLLLGLLLLTMRRGRRRDLYSVTEVPDQRRAEMSKPAVLAALGRPEAKPTLPVPELIVEDPQDRFVKEQVTILARNKPEIMAEMIKTWLGEDGRYSGNSIG